MAKSSSASGAVTLVASRYALALINAAEQGDQLKQIHENLGQLGRMIDESAELSSLINNPLYDDSARTNILSEIAARAGFAPFLVNFLKVLIENRRLNQLPGIIRAFELEIAKKWGWEDAKIVSAIPLSLEQTEQLSRALSQQFGKDIHLQMQVDPAILGGLVITVGSQMFDDSLATKLSSLKKSLLSTSHENSHSKLKKVG